MSKKAALKDSGLIALGAIAQTTKGFRKAVVTTGKATKKGAVAVVHAPKVAVEKVGTKVAEHRALNAYEEQVRLEKIQAGQHLLIVANASEEVNK